MFQSAEANKVNRWPKLGTSLLLKSTSISTISIKISAILASLKKNFEFFRGGTDQKFERGSEPPKIERGVRVPHGVIARGVHHPLPPLHICVVVVVVVVPYF